MRRNEVKIHDLEFLLKDLGSGEGPRTASVLCRVTLERFHGPIRIGDRKCYLTVASGTSG